jgi:GNAT superfamily N-acetyltransferase
VKHRAEFGISVLREYWGIGVGKALTKACIQCARDAGYVQLELTVVAGNERAISMYHEMGFEEFGRNPRGFNSRESGFQELVYMLLWL